MRISDWSSDVCSSDLAQLPLAVRLLQQGDVVGRDVALLRGIRQRRAGVVDDATVGIEHAHVHERPTVAGADLFDFEAHVVAPQLLLHRRAGRVEELLALGAALFGGMDAVVGVAARSEEHTSELQSLMRISYAVFCLKKK